MATNIERFNEYTAHFLAKLYRSFPEPCILDCVEAVNGKALPDPVSNDMLQEATTDREVRFCSATLKWLLSTGYLTGTERLHTVQVSEAILTPKGFEALNAVPSALKGKGSFGSQLANLAAEGSKEASKAAIGEVVGQVIGVAARHFVRP